MKIFAAGLATETNTFAPVPTALEDFEIQRGKDLAHGPARHSELDLSTLWGARARHRGDEFTFSLMAFAQPSGICTKAAFESLRDEILEDLRAATPVDIVLLMLHGAMVADGYEDCEEDILRRVRAIVGPGAIVGVELDLHCHLSETKIASADIVVTYKEYPHVDVSARAKELFDLAVAAKLESIRPIMALFDCRMVGFYPTTREPLRQLVAEMKSAERRPGLLSISFGHGFPFADLPHVGAKMLVITDQDPKLAHAVAEEFGHKVYGSRRQIGFDTLALSLEDALSRAIASTKLPVVVADQSDNAGGGAPSDATFALRWLLDHHAENIALATFYDPEVVKIAKKAGVGAHLTIRLGGKMGPSSGDPIDLDVEVLAIRDDYRYAFPQESGEIDWNPAGDVVALRSAGMDIVVGTRRCQCFSPSIFTDLGIDPADKRVLVVKSTQHFYAAFSTLGGEIIYMSGPGAVPTDPRQIPYHRLDTARRYPWASDPLQRDTVTAQEDDP